MTVSICRKRIRMSLGWAVLGAMILGLSLGKVFRPESCDAVIYFALSLMLYPAMLDVDFAGVKEVFTNPFVVVGALFLNFVLSPLLIYGLVDVFVGDSRLLGLILYGMVPGGGMAPAFTGMLRGNVNLCVTISALGSLLSLGFVPLWAKCLIGTQMEAPVLLIFCHLCFIVLIPWILAALSCRIIVGTMGEPFFLSAKKRIKALSGVGLCLLVFTISLLYGDRVLSEPMLVLRIAGPVATFLMILFLFSDLLGRILHCSYEDAIALTISTIAKNNSVSLALVFSTFGADAALVNAIAGPLVQLPILLSFVGLKKRQNHSKVDSKPFVGRVAKAADMVDTSGNRRN